MQKRKIELSETEYNTIAWALEYIGEGGLSRTIIARFLAADPTNDGAEVAILRVDPQ